MSVITGGKQRAPATGVSFAFAIFKKGPISVLAVWSYRFRRTRKQKLRQFPIHKASPTSSPCWEAAEPSAMALPAPAAANGHAAEARRIRIGVLALQGSFREHMTSLRRLPNVEAVEVRTKEQLSSVDGLIIPGELAHAKRTWPFESFG